MASQCLKKTNMVVQIELRKVAFRYLRGAGTGHVLFNHRAFMKRERMLGSL